MGTCRLRAVGVGMATAVGGRAQAGQNFAPVWSGAPQAERWMFMDSFLGEAELLCTTAVTRRTSNLRSHQLFTNQEMPSRFASPFIGYDRREIRSGLAVQRLRGGSLWPNSTERSIDVFIKEHFLV